MNRPRHRSSWTGLAAWSVALLSTLTACGGDGDPAATAAATDSRARALAAANALPVTPPVRVPPRINPAATGIDPPVVFNASASARAGQVIGLQGERFGAAPVVYIDGAQNAPLTIVNRMTTNGDGATSWIAVQLPAALPTGAQLRIGNATGTSAALKLNVARPQHLDTLVLVPGGPVRVFGRNLLLAGATPVVAIDGINAPLDLARSTEHMLAATVPASLVASASAVITVDNGNGSGPVVLDRPVTIQAASGSDPFGLGVSWAAAFSAIAGHVVDATTTPTPVRCDGTTDDTVALQDAIRRAATGAGGIVQLPAGVCLLNDWLPFSDHVVLQGAGKAATEIRYNVNYPVFAQGLDLIGLRNLTLTHVGTSEEGPLLKDSTRVVLQNVAIRLGASHQMYFSGNRQMVVQGVDVVQARGIGQQGPYTFEGSSGLVFENNTTRWVHGAPTFGRVHDAAFLGNRFSRDATSQVFEGFVHSMTLDFAHRVAVVGNTFDVIGGPITNTDRNDGETILTEGGSACRTENPGTVGSATATTLTDPTFMPNADPFCTGDAAVPENHGIAIVGGRGAGQTRRVLSAPGTTIAVDRAWDVVPDATSRYVTFVWGLEKSLIADNVLSQNPRGIWLYGTSVREVDIVGNRITDGGGIYLRSMQVLATRPDLARRFTVQYDVQVLGNSVVNTSGSWKSYVSSVFVNTDAGAFGIATLGVDIRGNDLVANPSSPSPPNEEYANTDGYTNLMRLESDNPYQTSPVPRLLGTVLTGNRCEHCAIGLSVGTGAGGTTLLDTQLVDTPKSFEDFATARPSSEERSTDTLVR